MATKGASEKMNYLIVRLDSGTVVYCAKGSTAHTKWTEEVLCENLTIDEAELRVGEFRTSKYSKIYR